MKISDRVRVNVSQPDEAGMEGIVFSIDSSRPLFGDIYYVKITHIPYNLNNPYANSLRAYIVTSDAHATHRYFLHEIDQIGDGE